MTFADFEDRIRDDLDRMLGPGGFSSARDIAAITVNRWPHGYSYVANSLFDPDDYEDTVLARARAPRAVWPLPIPTPAATPSRISPSIKRPAQCANWLDEFEFRTTRPPKISTSKIIRLLRHHRFHPEWFQCYG